MTRRLLGSGACQMLWNMDTAKQPYKDDCIEAFTAQRYVMRFDSSGIPQPSDSVPWDCVEGFLLIGGNHQIKTLVDALIKLYIDQNILDEEYPYHQELLGTPLEMVQFQAEHGISFIVAHGDYIELNEAMEQLIKDSGADHIILGGNGDDAAPFDGLLYAFSNGYYETLSVKAGTLLKTWYEHLDPNTKQGYADEYRDALAAM